VVKVFAEGGDWRHASICPKARTEGECGIVPGVLHRCNLQLAWHHHHLRPVCLSGVKTGSYLFTLDQTTKIQQQQQHSLNKQKLQCAFWMIVWLSLAPLSIQADLGCQSMRNMIWCFSFV
jgi:hypothetical protein